MFDTQGQTGMLKWPVHFPLRAALQKGVSSEQNELSNYKGHFEAYVWT